jgi:hypothetical protein
MTRARKPSSKAAGSKAAGSRAAGGKSAAQPRTTSPSGTPRPTGNRSKTDGKLHIRPGSERKAKTDSRPLTASRRKSEHAEEKRAAEIAETETGTPSSRSGAGRTAARSGTASRSGATSGRSTASGGRSTDGRSTTRKPNPPRLRGPQLDSPPPTTTFRDRDGKPHTFPDSALKRIAAKILTDKNKKWRYRPFGFPIFSPSGSEQEMHFDFYIYDNMDSVARLILLMPRESRETWDRVGRFKQQYPMYHYELWTPDALAKILAPRGGLGW